MVSLLLSLAVLVIGYLVYGRLTEKVFGPDDRQTPAVAINDGVDCVPMKPWKAFLVQLLNIAGTGPIFGPLMGAVFGPVVFLWIVLGSILGGAVHDYMSGMISSRHGGNSIAELSGIYLGNAARWVMRIFSVVLLVLCGVVFVTSPAGLISGLLEQLHAPAWMDTTFWAVVILAYYLLATLLPIDKVIGKLYPVFGVLLVAMAAAVMGGILFSGGKYTIPEISLSNLHPEGTPVWPYMFITVACGAISGFHATQSPMIAKCITSEKQGRKIFYGAMIGESVIALIWAAAGVAFYGATQVLNDALKSGNRQYSGYCGCDCLPDHFRRYGVPQRTTDSCGNIPSGPKEDPVQTGDHHSASGCRRIAHLVLNDEQQRFPDDLALFLLVQPDTGHDFPVGGNSLSAEEREDQIRVGGHRAAGSVHVCRQHDLYSDGQGRFQPVLFHRVSRRRGICPGTVLRLSVDFPQKENGFP